MSFRFPYNIAILFSILFSFASYSSNDSTIYSSWQNKHLQKIVFIENAGQFKTSDGKAASNLLFEVKAQGLSIYITTNGLTYFFVKPKPRKQIHLSSNQIDEDSLEYEYHRFDIDLQNATIKKENIIKVGVSSVDYNYFYPHCKQGIMSVKEYDKLTIKDVYPGIDWVLYSSNEKGLKYDFIIHAGANPQQINFLYRSLNPINLKDDGNINLNTSFGNFIDSAPECFLQKSHSKVNSSYVLKSNIKKNSLANAFYETEIGFNIDNYPKNETLIIDPLQLWWGTYYGGTTGGEGNSVTTDSLGNLFVLGSTNSLDIPLQPYGSLAYFQGIYAGNNNGGGMGDLFILKFTNAGQLLWATYFGGKNIDRGKSIKCDRNGDVFVLGETYSVDLPLKDPGGGVYYDTINGISDWNIDLFLGKFSNSGTYLWGTYYGGDERDYASELSIDIYNNVYFTGTTNSINFPVFNPGGGAFFQGNLGVNFTNFNDALILKFSNSGQRLLATYFGGEQDDQGLSTICDPFGNIYIGGRTSSANLYTLNPGGGAFFQTFGGGTRGYILKLNSNSQPIWSTYISGNGWGTCNSIICDKSGNLFMTGRFAPGFPMVNPGGGAFFLANNVGAYMVIAKFNPQSQMVWSTYYGTLGTDGFAKLTLGSCDEIYASFQSVNSCSNCQPMQVMNPGNDAYCDSTYNSDYGMALPDIFIAAFTNSGILKWGTYFGGIGIDGSMNMVCDKFGNIFYTGNQGYYYYRDSTMLQSYVSGCIKNPGGGTYFQGLPKAKYPNDAYAYCVIGKFTNPFSVINLSTTGCSNNDSIIVNTNSGWPLNLYNWSNGNTTAYLTNIPNGSYTCTITDGFLGCKQEQQIFFGTPTISVSITNSSNNNICTGQSINLLTTGANSYSWTPDIGLNSTSGNTVVASPNSTTNYTITGITSSNCSSTNTILVTVNSLPIIVVTGIDSICKGNSSSFYASGANNYSWTPSIGLNTSTGNFITANPNQTQTYSVIGIDNNNCIDTTTFILKIIPVPQLQIIGSLSVCIGNSTTLTATGADQFNWNFGTSASSNSTAIVSPTINSTYTLSGINSGICKDSVSFSTIVFQLPTLSLQAIDSICDGEEFIMQANGNGIFNWKPSIGLSCTPCSNPTATIQTSTQFVVTITDANLCINKDSIFIKIEESCGEDILIPNVFSPNSDGANDLFKIKVNNIRAFECDIYDRWGLKLFSSNDPNFSWNGIVPNGTIAPDGVYFYLIKITKYNNQIKNFKGHLTLVR